MQSSRNGIALGGPGVGQHGDTIAHRMPFTLENRHFLIGGTPGSGKTRLFFQIADQARDRGDKAFVIDYGGEPIKRHWRPGDIILDSRWPCWSPFAECRAPWDFDAMSKLIIPDGNGSSAEWHRYAQQLLGAVLKKIGEDESGLTSRGNADIIKYAVAAETDVLRQFIADDPIAGMLSPENENMVRSIRGIVSSYLAPWRVVVGGGQFSIRDWVTNDDDRRWVFLNYQDNMFDAVPSLTSCWLSVAITFALDLPEDETRRIWFLTDKLDGLNQIGELDHSLCKLRKRGGCVVAGLQSLSQLQEKYGQRGAQTLLSCFGTWVGLNVGDADMAEAFSRRFGEQDIRPADLMRLEEGHGYIQFPDMSIGEITCPTI